MVASAHEAAAVSLGPAAAARVVALGYWMATCLPRGALALAGATIAAGALPLVFVAALAGALAAALAGAFAAGLAGLALAAGWVALAALAGAFAVAGALAFAASFRSSS